MKSAWKMSAVDERSTRQLALYLNLPEAIAGILIARGYAQADEADRFLRKSIGDLEDPLELEGMEKASKRLCRAVQAGEKILVHGDFDADGITSGALLTLFLRDIGADVIPFVPNRLIEGHGIARRAIDLAKKENVKLLITCDCGSGDIAQMQELMREGIDPMITDHHEADTDLPDGTFFVNPTAHGHQGAQDELCGVGVAFMLSVAVRSALREKGYFETCAEPNLKQYLDIVALGTLADMAALRGQNRILVSHGLEQIHRSYRPGIVAMRESSGLGQAIAIQADDVGFRLAPRINAAARLGHSDEALELLLSDEPREASNLASKLEKWNVERKGLEATMTRLASLDAEKQAAEGAPVIVVSSSDFHPGVIGLVAQKLTQRFGVPCFVFSLTDTEARGSARSRNGVHLVKAMEHCSVLLSGFGGHKEAAGCQLMRKDLGKFRQKIIEAVVEQGFAAMHEIWIDAKIKLGQVDENFLSSLNRLRPFGVGNPEPVFVSTARVMGAPREVGKDHLKVTLSDLSGPSYSAVGFGMWRSAGSNLRGKVEVAYTPEENHWQGRREIQIKLRDVRSV